MSNEKFVISFGGVTIRLTPPKDKIDDAAAELCRKYTFTKSEDGGTILQPRVFDVDTDSFTEEELSIATDIILKGVPLDVRKKYMAQRRRSIARRLTERYKPVPSSAIVAARTCEAVMKTTPPLTTIQKLLLIRIAFEIEREREKDPKWKPLVGTTKHFKKNKTGRQAWKAEVLTGERCITNVILDEDWITSFILDFFKAQRWRHDRQDVEAVKKNVMDDLADLTTEKEIAYHDSCGYVHKEPIHWLIKIADTSKYSPSEIFDLQKVNKFDTIVMKNVIEGWFKEEDIYVNYRLLAASYKPMLSRGKVVEIPLEHISERYAAEKNVHTPLSNARRKREVNKVQAAAKIATDVTADVEVSKGRVKLTPKQEKTTEKEEAEPPPL